jgi:hypothetical protein
MRKNETDIKEILYEDINFNMGSLNMRKYNNSHYFLAPLFRMRDVNSPMYVNSFIGDSERKCTILNPLYVIFRVEDFKSSKFQRLNKNLETYDTLKFSYYAGENNGNLICYVFGAKEDEIQCYNHIVAGEYSKVPDWYTSRVSTFPFVQDTRKRIQGICRQEDWHKHEMENLLDVNLGNSELWSKFEREKEIFRYDKKKVVEEEIQ